MQGGGLGHECGRGLGHRGGEEQGASVMRGDGGVALMDAAEPQIRVNGGLGHAGWGVRPCMHVGFGAIEAGSNRAHL